MQVATKMRDFGKKQTFYVLSSRQGVAISYSFVAPIDNVESRRQEIRNKVIFHAAEKEEYSGLIIQ